MSRIDEYYRGLLIELQERGKKVQGNETAFQKIEDRKKAMTLDQEIKRKDAREKYRVEVQVDLMNLFLLYHPWIASTFNLKTRQGGIPTVFHWDPVLKGFADHSCSQCQKISDVFFVKDQKSWSARSVNDGLLTHHRKNRETFPGLSRSLSRCAPR